MMRITVPWSCWSWAARSLMDASWPSVSTSAASQIRPSKRWGASARAAGGPNDEVADPKGPGADASSMPATGPDSATSAPAPRAAAMRGTGPRA